MRSFILVTLLFVCGALTPSALYAQRAHKQVKIDPKEAVRLFDKVAIEWLELSDELGTYAGLGEYCKNKEYKNYVMDVLDELHHYDTLIYQVLSEKALERSNHELKVTLHEIEKVEDVFKPRNFKRKLNEDCKLRRSLERSYDDIKNDIGMESYDGKNLILENDIYTYMHKISHLVKLIEKHIHHILD